MTSELTQTLLLVSQGLKLLRAAKGGDLGPGHETSTNRMADRMELGITRAQTANARRTGSTRFAKSKTHKASSAEAILQHVLRQRGWSKAWTEGRLTGRQHLQLLEDVRQYGRAWMRHEAEAFFGRYSQDVRSIEVVDHQALAGLHSRGHDLREGIQSGATSAGLEDASVGRSVDPGKEGLDDGQIESRSKLLDAEPVDMGKSDPVSTERRELAAGLPLVEGQDRSGNESQVSLGGVPGRAFVFGLQGIDDDGLSQARSITGRILSPLKRWFNRARQFVRELIFAGAMAMAGPDDLQAEDIASLDRAAQVQDDYLNRFEREIIENPPPELGEALTSQVILVTPPRSVGQRIAQAESYGNAVWSSTINTGRAKVLKQTVGPAADQSGNKIDVPQKRKVFEAERRVHLLSFHEHKPCRTCIAESEKGWQPLGTLNEIGDSECMGNCDCYFEWKDFDGKIYVSPWGRHNPKGYNQPGAAGTRLPGIAYPPDQPDMPNQEKPKPAAKVEVVQVAPTREEIDAEVKKWIAGEPSKLTVKNVKPRVSVPKFELPEGYEWSSDDDRHDNP